MNEPNLAKGVLEYLLRYPDAQDTVEGIAEWWLLEHQVRHAVNDVRKAMDELEARGLVIKTGPSKRLTSPRYGLNKNREDEIRDYCRVKKQPGLSSSPES